MRREGEKMEQGEEVAMLGARQGSGKRSLTLNRTADLAGETGPLKGLASDGQHVPVSTAPLIPRGHCNTRAPMSGTTRPVWEWVYSQSTWGATWTKERKDHEIKHLLAWHAPSYWTCHSTKTEFKSNSALPFSRRMVGCHVVLRRHHSAGSCHLSSGQRIESFYGCLSKHLPQVSFMQWKLLPKETGFWSPSQKSSNVLSTH